MEIAKLAIVGFYAGLNALILMYLTFCVISVRRKHLISIGDGGNDYLARVMRGHGNATETIPIFFILFFLAAVLQTPTIVLHACGIVFTVGRLFHARFFVMQQSRLLPRFIGMIMTIASIVTLALGLIGHAIFILL